MKTYQDLIQIGNNETNRMQFVRGCISEYKSSVEYRTAATAERYDKFKNATIEQFQKLLYTISGFPLTSRLNQTFSTSSSNRRYSTYSVMVRAGKMKTSKAKSAMILTTNLLS